MPSATLGCDLQTSASLSIGDIERRSGLYILGRSGMGKSWLIVNLMLQDIQNGHGLFFLDPHGNAIDDLLARLNERYFDNVLLFDPQDRTQSFGINILACNDIHDLNERDETYTRAKGIFDKIWKHAYYELPWLQKILQFTLYAFVENPDYTLSEVPLFLTDSKFRSHIVGNIKYHSLRLPTSPKKPLPPSLRP